MASKGIKNKAEKARKFVYEYGISGVYDTTTCNISIIEEARLLRKYLLRKIPVAHSGYQIFQLEVKPSLKKENPDLSNGQLNALVGEKWRELREKIKDKYREKALKEKEKQDAILLTFKKRNL